MLEYLKKKITEKKGAISILGILITLIAAFFLQGYLDIMSANYILDEAQSMIDLTALTTLESSVDLDGINLGRMTIRPHNYNYEKNHINQSNQNQGSGSTLVGNASGTAAQKEIYNYTIWLDGTNAYNVENYRQALISARLKSNFEHYMNNFLVKQLKADGINIKETKLTSFTGTLTYDNWGVNKKYQIDTPTKAGKNNATIIEKTGSYIKMPQATIDAIIQMKIDVDSTFVTQNAYNYVLYNAQSESENTGVLSSINSTGTHLINSGFTSNGDLILTIRVVVRKSFY